MGSGPLTYAGSGTIGENILPRLVATFERTTGKKFGAISMEGSSQGFKAMMEGKVSMAGMSRPLKSAEKARGPYYAIIGYDALAVYVSAENPVSALSMKQLKDIFTGKVTSWKDVGGPALPIRPVRQNANSPRGAVQLFREVVLEGADFGPAGECDRLPECLDQVGRLAGAIAPASLAFATPAVKAVAINGVEPTVETTRSGEYPIARPLLLVSRSVPQGDLEVFFNLALSPAGQEAVAEKFLPRRQPAR